MSFFYDLNARLAKLASKQDAKQLAEEAKVTAPKSQLAESLDVAEAGYSAKAGRAGKDLGKPGKAFSKIAKSAGERYGSKAAGERVAGAVLNKLRHPTESTDESAFQAAIGKKKYGDEGMKALQKAGREHAGKEKMANIRDKYDKYDEGNAFTGALASTPKGSKFKVGNKEFTDTSSIEETGGTPMTAKQKSFAKLAPPVDKITFADKIAGAKQEVDEMLGDVAAEAMKSAVKRMGEADVTGLGEGSMKRQMEADAERMSREKFCSKWGDEYGEFWDNIMGDLDEGYAEMDAWMKSREKEKGTGRFDKKKISTGTVDTRKPETFDDPETDPEATGGAPKRKGRPTGTKRAIGAKGPTRKSKLAYGDMEEDLDTDGVMMATPSNMSSESAGDSSNQAAYIELVNLLKDPKTEIGSSTRNHVMSLVKQMVANLEEKAPPGAKAERMVKHIKKSLSKDGKLSDKDKAIAYATTWKAKKTGKVEEESTDKEDTKAERAGKKVTKDIEYDEKHTGKDDRKAEKAGKKVTKDIEYDDKKDKKEVEETTAAGSVATASTAPKAGKGMQFGKGVYESLDKKLETMISEGMNISVNMNTDAEGDAQKSITVSATGEDADKLAELLKMAGLESKQEVCPACGSSDCECGEEMVDENSPDWPTNTDTLEAEPNLRTYSGGLNGPKSTGQTTTPVIASQMRRQTSMEENVELERNLFKTWTNYKG